MLMLINLETNYNLFFKYANQYLECLGIKDTVKYVEIKSVIKTNTKKEVKCLFKDKNNKVLYTFIHQAIKGKGTKNKAIPFISKDNKELKHKAIGTLSCIADSFYFFTEDLGFNFTDMDSEQIKYFNFIINNQNFICLLSDRLIKHTINEITSKVINLQKTLTDIIEDYYGS